MRLDGNTWDEGVLHDLGARTVVRVLDEGGGIVAFDVHPDIDISGYDARLAEERARRAREAVPKSISDRQFAQMLAISGVITREEAIAWAARGELPAALATAVAGLPDDGTQFSAEMLLASATTYERDHPLVATLAAVLKPGGYSEAELDALWTQAAAL